MNRISLIIPVLNEGENLERLLPYLKAHVQTDDLEEIIVVDGGSQDNSIEIARRHGASVLESKKGRAEQMNAGAAAARGEILYFLHADSLPPAGFDRYILDAQLAGPSAGCFRLRFDNRDLVLAGFAWFTRWNWPICRGGDQSLFIPTKWFWELGGYNPEYIIYEDNEFTGRIYKKYPFRILKQEVVTSARKYERMGVWKLQYHFAAIHFMNFTGAGPERLYRYYRQHVLREQTKLSKRSAR